jgi:predicted PurR-regulated permease PerM
MSSNSNTPGLSRHATAFFVTCFVVIVYFLYRIFAPFLSALLWAVVLTVVFLPLFNRILMLMRRRRTVAASLTCLLILLLIILPVTFLGILITQQSIAFYNSFHESSISWGSAASSLNELQSHPAIQWLVSLAQKWFGVQQFDLSMYLEEAYSTISRFLVGIGPSLIKGVGGMFFNFFLIFITMFFLLRDGPALMDIIRSSSPLPDSYETEIIRRFQDVSYATFFGSLLTAMVQGVAGSLLFLFLGLPAPLFWGAIVSLVSLVPIVGGFLIWIPWAAYLILAGQTTRGIVFLAVGGLLISSIDNVLKPIIIQDRTNMHPLLVFLSVLGGLRVFGFLGILVGPLAAALFISFLNLYREEFRDTLGQKKPGGGERGAPPVG